MKYIAVDIFQTAVKGLPICCCMKDFVVTKYVGICNCVIFI